jgi:norsolorinic acid ketoreductase
MSSSSTVWLITGSNRGLGQHLVKTVLQRDNQAVIAASRQGPVDPIVTEEPNGSKTIAVRIDNEDDGDAMKAISSIKKLGINRIDNVVAMAGVSKYWGPISSTPAQELRDHFQVNAVASVTLFQAVLPLLKESKDAKFVYITSSVASMGAPIPIPAGAYGASKVAGNFLVQKVHQENENLTAFALNPGWVQTDMGNQGARANGMEQAPVTLNDSINGILHRIDTATRKNSSGQFKDFAGVDIPW